MNNNFPLISIAIAAYNHEKYIELCLNSILEDDYPNKEIVIINDGSKDNTKSVIENWIARNSNKIKIIFKSRENKGIPKTLNELIDLANGDYIAYIASDDCLLKGGIYKRYQYLKDNLQKMAVIADAMIINQDGDLLYNSAYNDFYKVNKEKFKTDESLKHEIVTNFSIPGPVLMVKKAIYKILGKYDENICYEDWEFYLRIVSKNLLGYIDNAVCRYRVHPANACRSRSVINITKDNRKIILKNYKYFKKYRIFFLKSLIYNEFYLLYLKFKFYLVDHSNNRIYHYLLMNLLKIKECINLNKNALN